MQTYVIVAIVFIIVGLAMLIAGIATYEVYNSRKQAIAWWIWFLMIGGLVVLVIAGIGLAFALRTDY